MKIIKYFSLICLLFTACSKEPETVNQYEALYPENLECMNMPRPDDSYNYPVYPDMEEWAKFNTGQEMADACQIPAGTLKNMSTQAVIQAIWEHPLLSGVFHRYLFQRDFESMFSNNNAYMELIGRKDAGTALLERLAAVHPFTSFPRFESQTLELLISQPVFLAQMDGNAKTQIVETAFKNDDLRQKDPAWKDNSIAASLRAITWLLIGRTMIAAEYNHFVEAVNENEQLKSFFEDKDYTYMKEVYGNIPQQIIDFGKNYLNE